MSDEPYRVNPWHLAGHLWVLDEYGFKLREARTQEDRSHLSLARMWQRAAMHMMIRGEDR